MTPLEPGGAASAASERAGLSIPLLCWGLSLAVVLPTGSLAHSLAETPRLLLALLPWLACIGLPRLAEARPQRRGWLVALALAVPPLALAAWLDGRAGVASGGTLGLAAAGLAHLALLGEAAHRARGRVRGAHALLWLATVPGCAALSAALSWGVTGGAAESGLAALLASLSPLAAPWVDPAPAALHLLVSPATLVCLALFTLAAFGGAGEEER